MKLSHLLAPLFALALTAAPAPAQEGGPTQGPKPGPRDLWAEPERVERGAEMLGALLESHGGLEAWDELEGLRFQMLESWRALTDRKKKEHKIHHRTAQFGWYTTGGDGFVRAEFVEPDGFTPRYRREVAQGNYAWAEQKGRFLRDPVMASRARAWVRSRFFLTAFPFSVHELGGELLYLKDLPGEGDRSLYGMRLAKPVVLRQHEEIAEFLLVVDNEAKRVLQLQYSYTGRDRIAMDKSTECYVDYVYDHRLGELTLPSFYTWFFEVDTMSKEFWIEDWQEGKVPPAALRRPWQAGTLWETELRADFWDPPAKEPVAGPPEKGDEGDDSEG